MVADNDYLTMWGGLTASALELFELKVSAGFGIPYETKERGFFLRSVLSSTETIVQAEEYRLLTVRQCEAPKSSGVVPRSQ